MLEYAVFSEQLPDNGFLVTVICFDGQIEADIEQEEELKDLPSYSEVKAGIEALNGVSGVHNIEHFYALLFRHLGVGR